MLTALREIRDAPENNSAAFTMQDNTEHTESGRLGALCTGGFYPQPLPGGTGSISSARRSEPHLCNSPEKGTLPGDQLRKLPHKSCSPSVREAYSGTERKVRLNISHSGAKLDRHSNLQTALSHSEHLNFTLGTRVGEV